MLLNIYARLAMVTLVDSLKWPIAVSLLVIFFIIIFRKPIAAFLSRSKGIKYGKFQMDSEPPQAIKKNEPKTNLENVTQIFRPETYNFFRAIVQQDTNFENLTSDNEKFEALLKYSIVLSALRRFEMIYDNIYGSQLALLQQLNAIGRMNLDIFEHYYNQAKAKYGSDFDQVTLESYSSFLYSWDLIMNVQNNGVEITTLGIDFLKYVVDARKNIYLPY